MLGIKVVLSFLAGVVVGLLIVVVILWLIPANPASIENHNSYHLLSANYIVPDDDSLPAGCEVGALRPPCPYSKGHRSRVYCGVGCHLCVHTDAFIVQRRMIHPSVVS